MRVAIMQPTYLPWAGYFGLMHYVDIFVLLDSVQFERRSWQQRNKIKTDLGEKLLTIPVIKKEYVPAEETMKEQRMIIDVFGKGASRS